MKISVCIPSYRRPKILLQTLENILEERGDLALETIVVDQTPAQELDAAFHNGIDRLSQQMPLTYVRRATPNANAARNHALQLAKADIVVYLDDDVLLSKGLFHAYLKGYESPPSNQEVMAVAGESYNRVIAKDGVPYTALSVEKPEYGTSRYYYHLEKKLRVGLAGDFLMGANMSLRRRFAIEAGGFDELLTSYGDEGDLSKRMDKIFPDKVMLFVPEAYVVHLRTPVGGHRLGIKGHGKKEYDIIFSSLSYYIRHSPEDPALQHVLRQVRRGPLRRENVLQPWRQPLAWLAFYRAVFDAFRHKYRIKSPFPAPPPYHH